MKPPDTPADEQERLAVLRSLDILDTQPEERFDRLVRLAQRIFDVPIALVSLVDENRQWFKAKQGIDACVTPREISFCGHTILGDEVFIVADALQDPRFADNPLVTGEPGIRFYAGCPLRHLDGSKLGTLCIIDTKPRRLEAADLVAMRDLAELAENELSAIQLATTDDLTQIANRRGFNHLAQNCLSLCQRQKMPVSLVYFDLDGFKRINDNFGHAQGDRTLVVFAEQMRQTFRESDIFARIGGDEFAVLLCNASIDLAMEIVDRFRDSLQEINRQSDCGYQISFSTGAVTAESKQDFNVEKLLAQADSLMYQDKHG